MLAFYQHIADQCECSRTAVRNHIDALANGNYQA
jgi:biotin operon repressor